MYIQAASRGERGDASRGDASRGDVTSQITNKRIIANL